ncbi:MAG: tetratricopeptide repeat protein [Candidatus Latescibacteria bacterium]|nr:tetratricopeptide repeat protein [Candidatus Latescibacterota bacterium]
MLAFLRRDPILIGILCLALILRLAYALQASSTPLAEVLLLDSDFYDRQARSLLTGEGWTEGVFFMNPLYPYLLAFLYWIGGPQWGVVAGVQVLIGTTNCWLVYALGAKTWGRQVGLAAAGLGAVYGVFIFYDSALLTATPILFLNLLALYCLLRWRETGAPRWLWIAGGSMGLSALARPLILIYLLLLGRWFAARRQTRAWGWLVLGCGLVLGPVLARNWLVGGEFALTTSSAGMNFYVGNNPQATGIYAQADFVPSAEPDQEREGFLREAERRQGHPLTPASASAYWLGEGWDFIRLQPDQYLALLWRKFCLFWHEVESQNNLSYYFAQDWVPFLRLTPNWGWVAPLALAAWGVWGSARRETLLELYCLAYLLGCLLFFVSSEYRLPLVPVLLLWAALGLSEGQRALQRRQWGKLGVAALATGGLAVLVNHADPLAQRLHSRRVDYYNFAVLYERRSEYPRAEEMIRRCLEIDPGFAPARQTQARLEQHRTVNLSPADEEEAARGLRLYGEGRYAAAAAVFAVLVARVPGQARLHNTLGLCYYKTGQFARADEAYQQALTLDPGYALAHYNLGLLRLAQGQPAQAVGALQQALALDPQYAAARYRLGEVLARQGDRAGAREAWGRILGQFPGEAVLQAKVDSLKARAVGGD